MTKSRLIDANAFAEHLERMIRTAYPNLFPGLLEAIDYARDFPTVDAVEVVRCKDCRNWEDGYFGYCTKIHTAMSYDGFCSNGERRNDNA